MDMDLEPDFLLAARLPSAIILSWSWMRRPEYERNWLLLKIISFIKDHRGMEAFKCVI